MLKRLSVREFLDWLAFAQLDPFDDARGDYRSAMVASLIANVNRDPKQRREPYKIEDFLLKFQTKSTTDKQPWQIQKAIAKAIAYAWGYKAKDKRKKKSR